MKKTGLLGLAQFMIYAGLHESEAFHQDVPKKSTDGAKLKYRDHTPKKQGQQKFTYPDGFECHALNKKNADKKHNRWKQINKK